MHKSCWNWQACRVAFSTFKVIFLKTGSISYEQDVLKKLMKFEVWILGTFNNTKLLYLRATCSMYFLQSADRMTYKLRVAGSALTAGFAVNYATNRKFIMVKKKKSLCFFTTDKSCKKNPKNKKKELKKSAKTEFLQFYLCRLSFWVSDQTLQTIPTAQTGCECICSTWNPIGSEEFEKLL